MKQLENILKMNNKEKISEEQATTITPDNISQIGNFVKKKKR